ncbi:hypothetical protein [Staphylothermus marinus]|uniref:hypothetical protein n=1 Tax=Staphylothermus marinus TaxID=2280 RepID=UPI00069B3817|nr:hypothetical protein [Staphylothermus marinus]
MAEELLEEQSVTLDHFYVFLKNYCYAVVVGNMHSNSYLIGYVKYCLGKNSIWRNNLGYYDRIVNYYSPRKVYDATPWKTYIPCYDSYIPVIPRSSIMKIFNPINRLNEIISSPRDKLEELTANLSSILYLSINRNALGVTGSLLIRIHNPVFSDIDMIVYGWKESLNIIEFINENKDLFPGFTGERLKKWIYSNAESSGLPLSKVEKLYRRWRRGSFMGRDYSIIYNNGVYKHLDTCKAWRTMGHIKVKACLAGGLDALNYPSKSNIDKYYVLKNTKKLRGDIEYVLSFDALYIGKLFDGGWVIISGLLQHDQLEDKYRILVGGREYKGYIEPL